MWNVQPNQIFKTKESLRKQTPSAIRTRKSNLENKNHGFISFIVKEINQVALVVDLTQILED